jgi:hypothetical protein
VVDVSERQHVDDRAASVGDDGDVPAGEYLGERRSGDGGVGEAVDDEGRFAPMGAVT